MSWVCDYCSTCNEEDAFECFVCGQPRSVESIRERDERLKAERGVRLDKLINGIVYSRLKVIFVVSVSVASAITIILLIAKIVNGKIDDIPTVFMYVWKRMSENIRFCFGSYIQLTYRYASREACKNLSFLFEAITKKLTHSLASISTVIMCLKTRINNQLICSQRHCVEPLSTNVNRNVANMGSTLIAIWMNTKYAIGQCIEIIVGCTKRIESHF